MRGGFTLIELLIVLAILGALTFVVVPSMSMSGSVQVSLAAKDTLRLMRYAHNMALQTQQPITLTFAPGEIRLASAFDAAGGDTAGTGASALSGAGAAAREADPAAPAAVKRAGEGKDAVVAGDIERVGLTKRYAEVAFAFLGYDDTIRQGRSEGDARRTDFQRRRPGQDAEEGDGRSPFGRRERQAADEPFTVTVRANGTTRPFSIRVYERDTEKEGDTIAFDFLCSGTIAGEE